MDYALESFSKRIEQLEMVNINLMNGYAELAVIVEALMTQAMAPLDEVERAEFLLEVKKAQKEMSKLLQTTAKRLIEEEEAANSDMAAGASNPPPTVANLASADDYTTS